MRRSRFSNITIICPEGVTGGPEALHQLAFGLQRFGQDCSLAYAGPQSTAHVSRTAVTCDLHPESRSYHAYRAYEPRVLARRELDSESLLIFPECYLDWAWSFARISNQPVACWWLGVPVGATSDSMKDDAQRSLLMERVIHLYQSHHAKMVLNDAGARMMAPLYDYVDRRFVASESDVADRSERRPNSFAYFPAKGGALAEAFIRRIAEIIPGVTPIRIENMSRDEVVAALAAAEVYLDFGLHPGKDRVPREAAALGAAVLLHRAGAATQFEDHPLEHPYLFSEQHVHDGTLARRVAAIFAEPERAVADQQYYRQKIRLEKTEFELQIRQFFLSEA